MTQSAKEAGHAALQRRGWVRSVVFTVGLLGLISLSVERVSPALLVTLIVSVSGLALALHYLFPRSLFFSVALTNLIGVYASIFVFFVETHFAKVDPVVMPLGFVGPILSFFLGTLWRREAIRGIIATRMLRDEAHFIRVLTWLVPVAAIGALTFFIPDSGVSHETLDNAFLGAMGLISAIVFFASHDVAVFLLDTGLLFEKFFDRAVRLIVPAFAFLTFYSLVVIVFASIYSGLDHLTHTPHFKIDGVVRELTFGESVYFSLTTMATVGLGDIAPATGGVRLLVAAEIISGVMLLLFGVNEIVSYSREMQGRERIRRRAGPEKQIEP